MDSFSWQTLHLLRPAWLLLLPVWWLMVWWLYRRQDNLAAWQQVCDPALLDYLLVGATGERLLRWWWCLLVVGSLLVMAVAGPVWKELAQPVYRQSSALVVLLDVSRSMNTQDVQPNRLQQARRKLHDLLSLRKEGQTALIVFAGEAFVVTPLTDDTATIDAQLQSIRTDMMPVQGSHPEKAIIKATALLQQAGINHGDIFLMGDELPPTNDGAMLPAIHAMIDAGHRFSAMAVGTEQGAPIPLEKGGFIKDNQGNIVIPHVEYDNFSGWADLGGGGYHAMTLDDSDIGWMQKRWLSTNNSHTYQQADMATFSHDQWREDAPWLLLCLLPLIALVFRRGWLVVVLVLYLPHPVQAFEWQNLWLNADQQGQRLLLQDQYSEAMARFQDPQWKAAAAYKAGDYQQAAQLLEPLKTAESYYNRGNALARMGDIDAAIAAYQACLDLQPKHADAQYNKKLLEQQKKEQQKNQKKQQEQGKGNKKKKQGEKKDNKQQQGKQGNKSPQTTADTKAKEKQDMAEQAKKDANQKESTQPNKDKTGGIGNPDTSKQSPPSTLLPQKKKITDTEALKKMETRQTYEQFLRRVPDDPGGLLRRKFLYQYQQQQQQNPSQMQEKKTW